MLRGEIPSGRSMAGDPSDFDLVYSIQKCCFTGSPKIQHFIKCKVAPGHERDVTSPLPAGIVRVVGNLHAEVTRNETGAIASVYRVDVERVDPD
jgi:hypothetical protein